MSKIRNYLKQSWILIKQNPLFSSIYIAGTGLSIALAMTVFIIFYVKFAPIYPEYNRNRTLVVKYVNIHPKDNKNNWRAGCLNEKVAKEIVYGLPHLDAMAMVDMSIGEKNISNIHGKTVNIMPLGVSSGFWDVFTFNFVSGNRFTENDVQAKSNVVVISEKLSEKLFGKTNTENEKILINGNEYTIKGVVENVSSATPATAADIWIQKDVMNFDNEKNFEDPEFLRGNNYLYMTAKSEEDKELLKKEFEESLRKFNMSCKVYVNDVMGQPDEYWKSTFRTSSTNPPDIKESVKEYIYIILALLFIPAINLGGMISSRMGERISELGLRKAYGATNAELLKQILTENMLLTSIGGLAGLIISYVIVLTTGEWILTLFDSTVNIYSEPAVLTPEMLLNPVIFGITLLICLILNIVSALIPATFALRRNIIDSLHSKR